MLGGLGRGARAALRDLRGPLVVAAAAVAVSSIPYLWGYLSAPPGLRFWGMVLAVDDMNTYLAKMLQGARGEWRFHLPFTTEDHPGVLLYTFFLVLGKLSAVAHLPMAVGYHVARIALSLVFLLTAHHFCRVFLSDRRERWLAFLLVCTGGGLGWLLALVGLAGGDPGLPAELTLVESVPFLVIMAYPHLALAQTLMLWGFLLWLGRSSARSRGASTLRVHRYLLAGLLLTVAGLVQPFQLPVSYLALGAYVAAKALRTRALPWREMAGAGLTVGVTLPLAGYFAFVTQVPAYHEWLASVRFADPSPLARVLLYGLPGALAVLGGWRAVAKGGTELFPVAWVGGAAVLASLPIGGIIRLTAGSFVPLAVLAALGGGWLLGRWRQGRGEDGAGMGRTRWAIGGIVAASSLTNVMALLAATALVAGHAAPLYQPREVYRALDYLREATAPGDTVMSWFSLGNLVPAYAGNRVVMGHGSETLRIEEKARLVRRFFAAETSDDDRLDLLRQQNVRYVLVGPEERRLGPADPDAMPYLEPVLRAGEIALYSVRR